MKTVTQSLVALAAIATLVGCSRKPEGEYDPDAFVGQPLVFAPEVTEGVDIIVGQPKDDAADSDGDGLSDEEEGELGLDPQSADSDGDGFDDGIEVDGFTDPLDATHHPYAGGWAIDPCNTTLEPSGNGVGQVTDNFALMDQHGEMVRLHDFCGREVLLVTSAMWCEPCQDEAPELQHWYETYADQGLMVITLLGENAGGNTPSQTDLESWATSYGLEHPVLADANWQVSNRWPGAYIPTMHLLGDGAVVIAGDTYVSESQLEQNLP